METEFKYKLRDTDQILSIINDQYLDNYVNRNSVDDIEMHAVYFDTAEEDLRKAGIAYRIRYENDRITATIKWDGEVNDGLHEREEFNLVINDERFANAPNISVFESSDAYDVLFNAAGNRPLIKTVEMIFTRKLIKIDTGASISAMSFDVGKIIGKDHECDILEMEIEWYYGDMEDFKDISTTIAERHGLEVENLSKLQRGFSVNYDTQQ